MNKFLISFSALILVSSIGIANAASPTDTAAKPAMAAHSMMKKHVTTASVKHSSVFNADKKLVRFTFAPTKGKMVHYALAGGHNARLNCSKGGTLTLGKNTESCNAKTSKITIKNGDFVIS